MKIKKLIYWLLPIVALMLEIGIFIIIDLVSKNKDPGLVSDTLGYILLSVLGVFLVLIGYLIAYIYLKTGCKSVVFTFSILFSLALGVWVNDERIVNCDFTAWFNVLNCIIEILLFISYPVILSVLLHWYSKRITYPEE